MQKLLLVIAVTAARLAAQNPTFTGVVNAASGIPPGLPNYGIAQGSVFTVYGQNLGPGAIQVAALPLPTTAGLAGTSITITVNGTTVTAPMFFTEQTQVAAVMPSDTPIGTGTLTVTYNGKSGSTPVTVVQSAFGISNIFLQFTDNGVGSGQAAIVTFGTNPVQLVTNTDTAKPGDTLILWGTGLGATTVAGDVSGAPFGNVGSQPLIFVGGIQSPSVAYWGRSPGSVGLDQIVFTVPQNAPLGCNVGIVVQTANGTAPIVSNGPTIALASTDGAACSDPTQVFPTSVFSQTSSSLKGLLVGLTQSVNVTVNSSGTASTTTSTQAQAFFAQFNQTQLTADAATFLTANYLPSFGSCYVGFSNNPGANGSGPSNTPLNAGTSITLTPPSGPALTLNTIPQQAGTYATGTNGSTPLPSGTWTISNGSGGSDIGPFTHSFPVPQQVTWTNEIATYSGQITRTNPYTITWTGGDSNGWVDIQGSTNAGGYDVGFECAAPTSAGQFTIPSSILLAMAPGASASGSIQVTTVSLPLSLGNIAGFGAALNSSSFQVSVPAIFK